MVQIGPYTEEGLLMPVVAPRLKETGLMMHTLSRLEEDCVYDQLSKGDNSA